MNIVLTGGSGFLGKHLAASLLQEGHHVTAIGREAISDLRIRWIKHDLLQESSEEIQKQLIGIDAVIHLAAIMPSKAGRDDIIVQNKVMTKNALSLVDSPPIFILASSVDVYPYSDLAVDENTPLDPISDYGHSKKESEEQCLAWSKLHSETKLLILRFSHLYGPADTNTKMIDSLVRNALLGKKSIVYDAGNDKRTYLFVEDAVRAMLLCLEHKGSGIFNVGGNNSYSVAEVIAHIEGVLRIKVNVEVAASQKKKGNSIVSSQKLAEATGFVAKTDLKDGLKRLLPKNILFDLDGPILDVKKRYHFVYKNFVMEHGGTPLPLEEYWEQKRLNISLEKLLQMSNCPGLIAEHKRYLSLHREEDSALALDRLQPDVLEILSPLSQKHNLYLITLRRNKKNLLQQLQELGVLGYFKEVLTMAPTTEDKWSHKVELIQKHDLQNQAGIIVGDTATEILAGKKTGLTTIAVSNGIRTKESLQKKEPHLLLNSVQELRSLPFFHF